MSYRPFVLCIIFIAGTAFGQGPVNTAIEIKLDRGALVGSYMLAPGDYSVRQITSANNSRVLEFTTDHGTKLAATVTAIPLLQNTPPSDTKVMFDNQGGLTRIAKILVQGKDYGYEFPKEYSFAQPAVPAEILLRYDTPTSTSSNLQNRGNSSAERQATPDVNAKPEAPVKHEAEVQQ